MAQAQLALCQRGQRILHLIKELDRKDGLAGLEIQFEQVARGLEFALPPGLVEQDTVKVLDSGGLQIEQCHRRLHRLCDRGKEDEGQALLLGQRNNLQFSRGDGGQRPFAAAEQVVEVVGIAVAPVNGIGCRARARPPRPDRRPARSPIH